MNAVAVVLLASATVPVVAAVAVYWFGFRLAKRHDEREAARAEPPAPRV